MPVPKSRRVTYFNELDGFAADWLSNLFPGSVVDRRSIKELSGADTEAATRVHLFAGIGGWEYALELAGWPPGRVVWTGSCPCQPFSSAGKRKGTADDRHLWPDMLRLVAECRPPTVFGEQVASSAGREWLAGVRADLEALGYAVGAADLCAAGVGAPHIRQRLYWVADAAVVRRGEREHGRNLDGPAKSSPRRERVILPHGSGGLRPVVGLANPVSQRRESNVLEPGVLDRSVVQIEGAGRTGRAGDDDGFWGRADRLPCRDGKTRRVEPGVFPLAHGVSGRVGLLRGYGNAIVPQVAAKFITAFLMAERDGFTEEVG